jgi:hypothetical protein
MDKIQIIEITNPDGSIIESVLIDHGNDQFTSMDKSEYDRRQAEQSTPTIEVTQ